MRELLIQYKKLHLWLLADLCLLAAFWAFRGSRNMVTFLANIAAALRQGVGKICYLFPFSVMELLYALFVISAAVYLIWSITAAVRAGRGRRGRRIYGMALGTACMGLAVYAGFCYLWGVHYYTDSFQDMSGIYVRPVARNELLRVTAYFAQQLSETASQVERDENGRFAVPRTEILEKGTNIYREVEKQFPFLKFKDKGVKGMRFSKIMSMMGFTGVYCPFTGESNVNIDSPACMLPSTVAHELAHQRSVASEQECNFLAILASTTCGDATYAYSGWLMGYIHLGNALYRVEPEAYTAIRNSLPDTVLADLRENNEYWAQFQDSLVQNVSNKVYDGFLKGYGDEDGMQSYGAVVDMLVVYYQNVAQ